jgi:hypothetical protein
MLPNHYWEGCTGYKAFSKKCGFAIVLDNNQKHNWILLNTII